MPRNSFIGIVPHVICCKNVTSGTQLFTSTRDQHRTNRCSLLPTAYVVRGREVMFSVCPHPGGGTKPDPVRSSRESEGGGDTPAKSRWGVPQPNPDGGYLARTCYAAVGMPLAFTQEDFLVHSYV